LKRGTLFFYEIKKLAGIRFIWIILVLLLGANMLICYSSVENKANEKNKQYAAFFSEYERNVQEIDAYMVDYMQKYEEIIKLERESFAGGDEGGQNTDIPELPNKYAPEGVSDGMLYKMVQEQKSKKEAYRSTITDIIERSKKELRIYDKKGVDRNSFVYIYQVAVTDKYSKLLDTEFRFEYPHGYGEFFEYDWVKPFIFTSVLFVCIFVFVKEQRDGAAPLIRSTKKGRARTAVAKLASINVVTFLIVILFTVTTLLAVYLKIGLSSPEQAMQAFYELCPFGIKVWQGILIFIAFKALAVCAFATLITGISVFFRNYIPVLAGGVVVYGLSYAVNLMSVFDLDSRLIALNLINAANPTALFERLRMYGFLGGAITQDSMLLCVYIPLMLIIAVLGTIGFCRGRVFAFSFLKKLHKPKLLGIKTFRIIKSRPYSILAFEFHKLVNWKSALILFVGIYMTVTAATDRFRPSVNVTDKLYKAYMEQLEGAWTQEKSIFIQDEHKRISNLISSYDEMLQKYQNKLISSEDYNNYLKNYYAAPAYKNALDRISEQEKYIKENSNQPYFIYDTGWKKLFLTDYSIYITALVILTAAVTFGNEYTSGFVNILRSTKNGRMKTFINKYAVVIFFSFVLSLFFAILQLHIALSKLSLPLWSAPITSIKEFGLLCPDISLSGFVIIRTVTIVLSNVIMAVITVSLSQLLRNATFAAILSGSVFILPRYLLFADYAYANLLDGTRFYLESAESNIFGSVWGYCSIYVLAIVFVAVLLLRKAKNGFCTT
jgi:hypothetical protein